MRLSRLGPTAHDRARARSIRTRSYEVHSCLRSAWSVRTICQRSLPAGLDSCFVEAARTLSLVPARPRLMKPANQRLWYLGTGAICRGTR